MPKGKEKGKPAKAEPMHKMPDGKMMSDAEMKKMMKSGKMPKKMK